MNLQTLFDRAQQEQAILESVQQSIGQRGKEMTPHLNRSEKNIAVIWGSLDEHEQRFGNTPRHQELRQTIDQLLKQVDFLRQVISNEPEAAANVPEIIVIDQEDNEHHQESECLATQSQIAQKSASTSTHRPSAKRKSIQVTGDTEVLHRPHAQFKQEEKAVSLNSQYNSANKTLKEFGFLDDELNIYLLENTKGDLHQALEWLLKNSSMFS